MLNTIIYTCKGTFDVSINPCAALCRVLTLFTFFGQFLVYVSPSIQMAQIMASGEFYQIQPLAA